MSHVDGNALLGLFEEIFSREMSTAIGKCGACGKSGEIARTHAYVTSMGAVMRCDGCGHELGVIVRANQVLSLRLTGLSSLRFGPAQRFESL